MAIYTHHCSPVLIVVGRILDWPTWPNTKELFNATERKHAEPDRRQRSDRASTEPLAEPARRQQLVQQW